ncbi:MAG: 6-phosphogluconolactonase [Chlamydiia bacterium]|nr:6-phosphogluconolactonase [Chlamydiia bacterium]
MLMHTIESWDERRDYIALGTSAEMVQFATEHWIHTAKRAIQQRGKFAVALSGGSTPQEIYRSLAGHRDAISWERVFLFWSDERSVLPDHPDSNFRIAMESGLKQLPIPKHQIFRMEAEKKLEEHARDYEEKILHHLGKDLFDLVMLGIGEDGHTASLFPDTAALQITNRLVVPNWIASKNTWRMTLTYPCINQSFHTAIYVLGSAKQDIVAKILDAPIFSSLPASQIGSVQHKALWILDKESSLHIQRKFS